MRHLYGKVAQLITFKQKSSCYRLACVRASVVLKCKQCVQNCMFKTELQHDYFANVVYTLDPE